MSDGEIPVVTSNSHIPICSLYEQNFESYESNSSAGFLDGKYNKNGKIYKAYLIITMNIQCSSDTEMEKALKAPITLLYGGNSGETIVSGIKSTCTNFYYDSIAKSYVNRYGAVGYIDITDFIKENGYGWYYGCNIPASVINGADMYTSWKILIIEENDNIPVRKLALSVGDGAAFSDSKAVTVEQRILDSNIKSKKSGIVTGQLLYGISGADVTSGYNKVSYSMDGSNFKSIETSNGVRLAKRPNCMTMSRNGIPIDNEVNWTPTYYYIGNGKFTTTYSDKYFKLTGDDMELIDIDGTTDKHNVVFENSQSSLILNIWTIRGFNITCEFLGVAVDIDVPEYTSTQSSIGHDTYYATVNGTITNSSADNGIGMHDGKVVVSIDKGLKILSTSAYFTTTSGEKVNLTEDMYTIDETNNTITYIFGKDSNGKNLKGESLTYIVETQAIEADNLDGKKYIANNEVYANGKLTNNNVDTEHYMDRVVWNTSSVTIENPPYAVRDELILTTEVNLKLAEGRGGVELDWTGYNPKDRYFVVYRKEENAENFEKIVDLEDKLSANTYTDILGNDKTKPNAPTVSVGTNSTDIQISLSSNDNGTTYTYYVEAYDSSTRALLETSNKQSVKI